MNVDIDIPANLSLPSSLNLNSSEAIFDNLTICADHLIGDLLEGISGRIIWGIIQLALMLLGNVGNILSLIVLNRRFMRKGGVNNLLQGLAISDIIAPTIACIPHIIYYYGPRNNWKLISFVNSFVMPIATGATFASNWIVVTITCFRLLIVVKPLYSQVYCSSRNERKALLVIFVSSILSITPYYYFHSHLNYDAQNVLKVVSAVLSLLGPWVICVVLWILLIRVVNREIGEKGSNKFILNSEVVAQRLKSKSKITKMVLVICFCNVICQLPVLILTIFGIIDGNPCGSARPFVYVFLLFLSNLLLIVNHSINFFIYSWTNSKFRYTLKTMCLHCCFFHNYIHLRRTTQRQTITFDDSRKCYTPRSGTPKFDCNTQSNSRSRESQYVVLSMRVLNASNHSLMNNQIGRIAL